MLIENHLRKDKVFGIKLVTGEDVLAKVIDFDRTTITVHEPHTMMIGANAHGQATAQLVPLLPMLAKDGDPVLEKTSVVAVYTPDAAFLDAYEQTVSELILPSQQIQT